MPQITLIGGKQIHILPVVASHRVPFIFSLRISLKNRSMLTRVASIAHVAVSFLKTMLITCRVVAASAAAIRVFHN